ncbi:MAG: hypothetical protein R3E39_27960 [Anaerolineae bacterium]
MIKFNHFRKKSCLIINYKEIILLEAAMSTNQRKTNVEYKLPNMCANCAEKPAEVSWRVHQQEYASTKREMNIVGRVKQTDTYNVLDFTVGVCKECEAKLKKSQKQTAVALGIGCVPVALGFIGLLAAVGGVALTTVPHSVFIVLIGGGIIFGIAAMVLLGEQPLAKRSRDGKMFTFRNKKYEVAFGQLNPNLIYRK